MGASGDFRNDAAIGPMRRLLPGEFVRQHAPIAGDQRGSGFVATRFETEDQGHEGSFIRMDLRI